MFYLYSHLLYFLKIFYYLLIYFLLLIVCVCMCVHVCGGVMHVTVHMWKSEDNFLESVIFLHLHVGSRD